VNISGKINEDLKEIGRIIKWMEKEFLNGQTEGLTKENIKMIKSMEWACLNGNNFKSFYS
jgi:hypothetical protein